MTHFFNLYLISGSLLALTATSVYAQGQDFPSDDVIEPRAERPLNEGDYPKTVETLNDTDQVQGNPYFTNDWIEGQVKLDDGTEYENVSLKYDVYRNELVVKSNEGKEVALDPQNVRSFTLGPPRLANLAWFERAKYVEGFDQVPDD